MPNAVFKSFIPNRKLLSGFFVLTIVSLLASGCRTETKSESFSGRIPNKMLWAWERPEDLRFIDNNEYGVAFLAQTLTIAGDDVPVAARRQPLEVAPETFLMAVTRIETDRNSQPKYSTGQVQKITRAVMRTLYLKNVKALQIDFDAAVSERAFYRSLLKDIRAQIPPGIPFSMTALASWCTADSWLTGLPVDEAVPMAFRMGADEASIRNFLGSGKDWQEPLCQTSYGFAISENFDRKLSRGRRIYFFNDRAWKQSDLDITNNFY